jgi:hypothetical protein
MPLKLSEMLMLNLLAEVGDIMLALDPSARSAKAKKLAGDFQSKKETLMYDEHCSALIRLSPDGQDLFSTHTTWTAYNQMLRTYKYYGPFTSTGNAVQFSSYPGCVSSVDDYYQMLPSNMIVIETTNSVANMTLYEYVVPQTIPTFVRVMVANAITTTGQDWAEMYAENNSGTYNNRPSTAET